MRKTKINIRIVSLMVEIHTGNLSYTKQECCLQHCSFILKPVTLQIICTATVTSILLWDLGPSLFKEKDVTECVACEGKQMI